jgi:hypothetical protein
MHFSALDFIAQLTLHIPPRGRHLVRRYGVYSSQGRQPVEQQTAGGSRTGYCTAPSPAFLIPRPPFSHKCLPRSPPESESLPTRLACPLSTDSGMSRTFIYFVNVLWEIELIMQSLLPFSLAHRMPAALAQTRGLYPPGWKRGCSPGRGAAADLAEGLRIGVYLVMRERAEKPSVPASMVRAHACPRIECADFGYHFIEPAWTCAGRLQQAAYTSRPGTCF